MSGSTLQIASYVFAGSLFGLAMGLVIAATISKRRISRLVTEHKKGLEELVRQRDKLATNFSKSRSTIQTLKASHAKRREELESATVKKRKYARSVRTLLAERETTKVKVSTLQQALDSVQRQTTALQSEFERAAKFYKGELVKSFDKRKAVEKELQSARLEQESFNKLVESSILEHGSSDEMVAAAQLRFGQLEVLERNINKLEAENAQLRDDAVRATRENSALSKQLEELDELRINNKQLVRCVEVLEESRQQHEHEAEQFRDQADQSEQLSDTLRLKLNDLEQNFAAMEKQQQKALNRARHATAIPRSGNRKVLRSG